jgi:hypothetical protein
VPSPGKLDELAGSAANPSAQQTMNAPDIGRGVVMGRANEPTSRAQRRLRALRQSRRAVVISHRSGLVRRLH